MAKSKADLSETLCAFARNYPDAIEGTSCTQTSFKVGKKAFLYVGMQGGRFKAMLKLDDSMPEAVGLAEEDPEHFGAGSTGWVTARFAEGEAFPKRVLKRWLDESYQLSTSAKSKAKSSKKKATTTTKKKIVKKRPLKKSRK